MRIIALILVLLFFPLRVRAVEVAILQSPATVGEEKFAVTVKITGAAAGTNYLRIDLFREGSTEYFGETDNSQSWYSGSEGKQYLPITIVSGIPNLATVSGRIGTPSLSDYPGPGNYKLRVRRYTGSGGQGSEDPQAVNIALSQALPSPSPSPTPSPSPSPTPSPSPSLAPSPTPKPSPAPARPSPILSPDPAGTVAGVTTAVDLSAFGLTSPTPSPSVFLSTGLALNRSRARQVIFLGAGLLALSLAGFFGYRHYRLRHL